MEESKKKPIMVAVIVVALVLAVAMTFLTRSGGKGGLKDIQSGQMIWVKCSNPDCNAEYPMDNKDYLEIFNKLTAGGGGVRGGLVCEKCDEESVYKAIKCGKCGLIFFAGSVRGDFTDRCPDCGYSKKEEARAGSK